MRKTWSAPSRNETRRKQLVRASRFISRNSMGENNFVETLEYRRFKEFCDACSHYCYIGLCYGSPGVGKTLSAQRYSRWSQIQGVKSRELPDDRLQELAQLDVVLYTTPVVNTPREIEQDTPKLREF